MKKLLLFTMLLFSVNVFGQVVNPETKKLPEFKGKVYELPYVEQVVTLRKSYDSFVGASFLYILEGTILSESIFYACYDKENKSWVMFAVCYPNKGLWHINKKFIHLLKF